jgi:small conductance mechanosensitive channel
MHDPATLLWAKLVSFANGFWLVLPNIVAGLVFLVVCYVVGRLLERWIGGMFGRRERIDLGALLGSIAFGLVMIVAVLIAAAIIFPSVKPSDVLGTLGIGSVAIGFAFKDILQNLLAGLLLLINRPYRRGDQIVVKDFEGTVEHIESRATLIKTYDGRRVIIPNADVYTSPVVVNTAFPYRRDQYDVGVGYGDQTDEVCRVFVEAVRGLEGVCEEGGKTEALPWGLDASQVTIRVRWWTKSLRTEQVHVKARVIKAIFAAAREHSIDLPFPTQQILFHDQTEATDGDRARQREGWPAGDDAPPAGHRQERTQSG